MQPSKKSKWGIYGVSLLGAMGTGLQNFMAVADLVKLMQAGWVLTYSLALTLGGLCSGMVNFFINVELLEDFYKRLTQKPIPTLTGWARVRYWLGSAVFVVTGILFGLTAFAFGPIGPLAAIAVAAGIFVAVIMTIQELETWLKSFDGADKQEQKSLAQLFQDWKESLNKEKLLGVVIAVGNVVALSLLFTFGLASFLMGVGLPALPAFILGAVAAFTGGAFTEFYFYNQFLSKFCDNLSENWQNFWNSKYSPVGLIVGGLNALVNGILSYVGITLMVGLLTAASIAVPPLAVVIAVASTASVFAGFASFILGIDFWERNSKALPDLPLFGSSKKIYNELELDPELAKFPDEWKSLLDTQVSNDEKYDNTPGSEISYTRNLGVP